MKLNRHQGSFLTLQETATRGEMPYYKTYDFAGDHINAEHEMLGALPCDEQGYIKFPDVEGYLSAIDALKLYEMVYFCDGDVLDLGTGYGLSALIAAMASKAAGLHNQIVTIEILTERFLRAQVALRRFDNVNLWKAYSGTALKMLADEDRKFNFIFVDHQHDYWGVYTACSYFDRLLNPGAFILFHDLNDKRNIDEHYNDYAVHQAVFNALPQSKFEFWGIYGCAGLFRRQCEAVNEWWAARTRHLVGIDDPSSKTRQLHRKQ